MPQGSPEWFQARMGMPTASEFSTVMREKGVKGGISLERQTYMRKLAGEIITKAPMENFSSPEMERGKMMEAEARDMYAFAADVQPELVGFIKNGSKGASPDSLIGKDGMAEIKTAAPHRLIAVIEQHIADPTWSPPEHYAQCQGNLWVAEREWIDLIMFWPKMPLFTHRIYRDQAFLAKLSYAVDVFNSELQQLVDRIKRYGGL